MRRGVVRERRPGRRRVVRGWSEPQQALEYVGQHRYEDGYEGSAFVEASLWEVELEAICEAEAAGGAGDLGQAGAGHEAGREEEGPSPS